MGFTAPRLESSLAWVCVCMSKIIRLSQYKGLCGRHATPIVRSLFQECMSRGNSVRRSDRPNTETFFPRRLLCPSLLPPIQLCRRDPWLGPPRHCSPAPWTTSLSTGRPRPPISISRPRVLSCLESHLHPRSAQTDFLLPGRQDSAGTRLLFF